jgi:hypothetical protein
MRRAPLPLLTLLVTPALAACSYVPPRFADAPPVVAVHDHRPVPRPRPRLVLAPFDVADAYVRQGLTYALDPADAELADDVNALDEVVLSSWWSPPADAKRPLEAYRQVGPPERPLVLEVGPVPTARPGAVRVRDARGIAYVVVPDPPDRPGLVSGAGVVASRLLFALGWRVPEAHAIQQENGAPALAIRWPIGVDLGPTPPFRGRFDDPNDTVARKDRRTLRALPRVFAWLAKRDLDVGELRDSYVGEDGSGYVLHWVLGLEGALGVEALERQFRLARDPDRPAESSTERFFTLGLGAPNEVKPPVTPSPGLGVWGPTPSIDDFDPSPPFEPLRYLTPADDVWIGERLAALSREVIEDAARATPLSDADRAIVVDRLDARRRAMAAWCLDRGTPLDPVSVVVDHGGEVRVRLVDHAVAAGLARIEDARWSMTLYDAEGEALRGIPVVRRTADGVDVALGSALVGRRRYLVVRIRGWRGAKPLPRAMEVHLALAGGRPPRVVGVVH